MYGQSPVVKRYPARQRRGPSCWLIGCGCLSAGMIGLVLVSVVGFVLFRPQLTALVVGAAGLEAQGETDAIFETVAAAPTTTPVPLQNATRPQQVTVDLGSYGGQQAINPNTVQADVQVGSDATTGQQTAVVRFTEAALLDLCRQQSTFCNNSDPQFQNVMFDLRPGGVIVYADVNVPTDLGIPVNDRVGLVLRLDNTGRRFAFAGVDLNGLLFDVPRDQFGDIITQYEQAGNDLLSQMTVDAGGGSLDLDSVQIDDTTLTLVLR